MKNEESFGKMKIFYKMKNKKPKICGKYIAFLRKNIKFFILHSSFFILFITFAL